MKRRLWWGLALGLALAGCHYRVNLRNAFAELTYPTAPKPSTVDVRLQLYAIIQIEAVTAYENPVDVAACLRSIDATQLRAAGEALDAALKKEVKTIGKEELMTIHQGRLQNWAAAAVAQAQLLGPACKKVMGPDPVTTPPAVPHPDRALLIWTYARIAGAVMAQARSSTLSVGGHTGRDEIYKWAESALDRVAVMLERSPQARTSKPVLALSGGSANGAFTAGFLFELLSARERAINAIEDDRARQEMDAETRFEAMVGTSVGSLIAQLLDLYFVEEPSIPRTADGGVDSRLAECSQWPADGVVAIPVANQSGCFSGAPAPTPLPGDFDGGVAFPGQEIVAELKNRPIQQCALTKLFRNFAYDNEPRLLCVERAPATGLVGFFAQPRPNFIRFDEMSRVVMDPMLSRFSKEMLANPVVRTVVAVETQQNQTLGLDERSCLPLTQKPAKVAREEDPLQEVVKQEGREYCLSSSVMASVVLPFFARPLRHTYSGLDDHGECGTWLDGGLRSAFPAYRALRMSHPIAKSSLRVLGIDTGRLDGLPSERPTMVHQVALNAIGQMAGQNTIGEVAMSQQFANQRLNEYRAIDAALTVPPPIEGQPLKAPQLRIPAPTAELDDAQVLPIFVPNDAPPALIAEAGYAFDEYVMRGLFTWGRRAAIHQMRGLDHEGHADEKRELARRLGWDNIAQDIAAYAKKDAEQLKPWFDAYEQGECDDFHDKRFADGQKRIHEKVRDCGVLTAGPDGGVDPEPSDPPYNFTPHYFACPSGALEVGVFKDAGVSP